jgi:hypothetical protein
LHYSTDSGKSRSYPANDYINVVVFSKDRAAQLDALLQSIRRRAKWLWPPTILFAASGAEYLEGYCRLRSIWNLTLSNRLPLKAAVLHAIDRRRPLTTFLVDDAVFYRDLAPVFLKPGRVFAPRLGRNCIYCYPLDCAQREGELDFAYWFSLDGHIYRTEEIVPGIEAAVFETPNQFEAVISRNIPMALKTLHYAEQSALVGIPHNIVGEYDNRHDGGSAGELNERFLRGERIDLEAMDFSKVIGCHQAIPYRWKKADLPPAR